MYSFLSIDGSLILTYHEGDEEPEELTPLEFIQRYGEENLPARELCPGDVIAPDAVVPLDDLGDAIHYYESLERLCRACGEYSRLYKLHLNAIFGTPQEVLTDKRKLEARRHKIAKLEESLKKQELTKKACVRNYGFWHQRVGFFQFSEANRERVLSSLSDNDFRERIYRRIRKYKGQSKLMPWGDLYYEVALSFLKQGRLPLV
ncbi:MAG: hypothetical protein Q4A70_03975 [Candidatus Saccharibacteria bacterium]|nr:hypothetical protein [Candidatus Saccharibacteria bacterium]